MMPRLLVLAALAAGPLPGRCGAVRLPDASSAAKLGESIVQGAVEAKECGKLRQNVSAQEEYTLGGAVAVSWVAAGGGLLLEGSPRQALHRYLNTVGKNLAAQSGRPALDWTFGVLEDPHAINAVSAPGGYVFVTRGLLKAVENEAQLAGVLAHEIAHVERKHALERYADVKVGQCGVAVAVRNGKTAMGRAGVDLTPAAVDALLRAMKGTGSLDLDRNPDLIRVLTDEVVDTLVEKGFGPEDEHDADEVAAKLLLSAGYDPEEYVRFLDRVPEGRRGFSNHPSRDERQRKLRALLSRAPPPEDTFTDLPAPTSGLVKPELPPAIARSVR